ncbi:FAD-binding oxidoreductase [Heliobacterium mobile]|nr:FAD-binding oxidoreductase [Heliobacterium mobile]
MTTDSCQWSRPDTKAEISRLLQEGDGSLLGRGTSLRNGEARQNSKGTLVLMDRMNRFLNFNKVTGTLRCEAGVTIKEIMDIFLPQGWFLPVTADTKQATLGGMVAADTHGNNHHKSGCLSEYVTGLEVMVASGEIVYCSREENADLFSATVGGMGLTGIILTIDLGLRKVPTAYMSVNYERARDLDQLLGRLLQADESDEYVTAWIDCTAGGSDLGRGIVIQASHAVVEQLPPEMKNTPLILEPEKAACFPCSLPEFLWHRKSVKLVNSLYYLGSMFRRNPNRLVDCNRFFYGLDRHGHRERFYGKEGYVQYECVIPHDHVRNALVKLLEKIGRLERVSCLAKLNVCGPCQPVGLLSFPMKGVALNVDIPVRPGLLVVLDELDQWVLQNGGRTSLNHDNRMNAELFQEMYPDVYLWKSIKHKYDPDNRFMSHLGRRLQLTGVEQ